MRRADPAASQNLEVTINPVPQQVSSGSATFSVTAAAIQNGPINFKWLRYTASGGSPVIVFEETK